MTKQELRRFIRQQKAQYRQERLQQMSAEVCESLQADGMWRASDTVLMYHALPDEVSLSSLIEKSLQLGKKVLLPVVVGDDLVLRVYSGPDSLQLGAYGIFEPVGEDFPATRYGEITLALVPGMAFDGAGNRLGRGKGYYDRLLPRLANAWRIGVCFPFQKVDAVPSESHDMRMNEVS